MTHPVMMKLRLIPGTLYFFTFAKFTSIFTFLRSKNEINALKYREYKKSKQRLKGKKEKVEYEMV